MSVRSLVLLLFVTLPVCAEPPALTDSTPPAWLQMTADDFFRRPEAGAQIDPLAYDRALLAAAIFHQTNRQRQQLGLPLFRPQAKATDAADLQASWTSVTVVPDHRNPIPNLEWPIDRVRSTGLKPTQVGENLATVPIFDVGSATQVAFRREGAQKVFLDPNTGEPAAIHTYASFAANIVARWMNSPAHRENIANPAYEYLGCSVRPTKGVNGADLLCAVQVFVAMHYTGAVQTKQKASR